jgi:hypothetical protein
MDLYNTIEECQNASKQGLTFYEYDKYKSHYNVIDSWNEIEIKLLNTYTQPKKNNKLEEIDDNKLILDLKPTFYKQTRNAVKNSLYYMFYKYGSGYYVRIRNGELNIFCYIWNDNWENTLSKYLIIDPKYAKRYTKSNKKKWPVLGSMVRVYEKKYEGYGMDFYYSETKYLLQQICKYLPDCDFIVANKDNLVIKKDLTEACEEIVGSISLPMQKQFIFKEYCPIFSYCWNNRYCDLPFPTPDDINRIYRLYAPEKCKNHYIDISDVPWNQKKATAVFRGSFTGSSANIKINPRLNLAMTSYKWKFDSKYNDKNKIDGISYLDAGLSSKGGFTRGRKEINDKYIRFVDNNYWEYLLVEPLSHQQQTYYKYIIYVEGNVSAYRGAFLFSLKSVVLWIKSNKYYLWFEPKLIDNVNCIFIKNDLSDLEEKITWLKQNDDKAQEIANSGYNLYEKYLTKKSIEEYIINSITISCMT